MNTFVSTYAEASQLHQSGVAVSMVQRINSEINLLESTKIQIEGNLAKSRKQVQDHHKKMIEHNVKTQELIDRISSVISNKSRNSKVKKELSEWKKELDSRLLPFHCFFGEADCSTASDLFKIDCQIKYLQQQKEMLEWVIKNSQGD